MPLKNQENYALSSGVYSLIYLIAFVIEFLAADAYELAYQGGIMWLMPRAAIEGRGGDSGFAFTNEGIISDT